MTDLQRERRAFRAFLHEHRYAPQGRLARAGDLEDRDLDAMLRGALPAVWRWVFRHVRSEQEQEIVWRNVRLARQQQESGKRERDAAHARREALESRRAYLHEAVTRARERENALLHSLRALEDEDARASAVLADRKQRQVLQRAARAAQDDRAARLSATLSELRARVAVPRRSTPDASGESNPVAVLLREYLRMLKAGDAEVVDFGDADVAHLREYGGGVLVRWLSELAAVGGGDLDLADQEEAAYTAHVEEHAGSSRAALAQIQQLLQASQKEHIAKFLETQEIYASAERASARVRSLQQRQQQQQSDSDYDLWDASASSEPRRVIADLVRLEIESHAQRAALGVAQQTHAARVQQLQAARQQKAELGQKLELMQSFEQRQQEILDQLNAMLQQNREVASALTDRQAQLQLKFLRGQSDAAVSEWQRLAADELRAFASTQLAELDTAILSVELAPLRVARSDGGEATDAGTAQAVRVTMPFAEFYINRIRRDGGGAGGGGGGRSPSLASPTRQNYLADANGDSVARVLAALRVPEHGGWAAVLDVLQQQSDAEETERALRDQLELLRLQAPGGGHSPRTQSETLLAELRRATDELQASAFPQIEEIVATNTETLERVLVRLRTAVSDWYEQSGWSVRLGAASSAGEQQQGPLHVS